MDVDLSQDGSSSQSDNQNIETTPQSPAPHVASQGQTQAQANAIAELDKMEKFRFEGQEYTPKALKEAILRMQDYTRKTQEHSRNVESFKQEQKFYENLASDLDAVRKDRNLASEFIKIYPEKFHGALKQVLSESTGQSSGAQGQTSAPFDVETQGRLAKLEKHFQEQEIAKNKTEIESNISKYSKQFPKAIPELAIAQVFEAYNSGVKPTAETWEQAFKASADLMEKRLKEHYGELQKKQTVANSKARDVDTGGGTPGRAPKKFGKLSEVTEYAAESLSNR